MVRDVLRIYVLWTAESCEGRRLAELIASHFDGLGMERDGVAIRVPVRVRSTPWEEGSLRPRDIDLDLADHNVVVLLHDGYMQEEADAWNTYVCDLHARIDARLNADVYIPFGSPDRDPPLQCDGIRHIQYAQRHHWGHTLTDQTDRDARLLLHIVFCIRQHLRKINGNILYDEALFVSHAKADGDKTARMIVDYVNDTRHDVPLSTFYDAMELAPGEDYKATFEDRINNGTLLAIVSDVYDSRPWCVWELTTAKRAHRPIILADVGGVRTSRTYPYGANVPKVHVSVDTQQTGWIEHLLVEALSEGLRCDLFQIQARKRLRVANFGSALLLPRPPELFDLIDVEEVGDVIVYPDPPLGRDEAGLLRRALEKISANVSLYTLSEVR